MDSDTIKKVSGFNTMAEYLAYEKGRSEEQQVILDYINKWDGECSSEICRAMYKAFQRLQEKDFYKQF